MAPINHLGFHLGTYKSALSAHFINEKLYKYQSWVSSQTYPDFSLQHRLSIKTLIGHKLSELELHSSEYLIGTKLSDGHDGFLVLLGNSDGLPITIPQLLSKALLRLLEMYQAQYETGGDEITYSCCIGIPIYFTNIQRSIVHDAARQAGFTSIALVHETTAAALLEKEGLLGYPYVVLVDMGVLSMQVSVVKCQNRTATQILSHAFDSTLGGRAFDMVLLNHFVVKFREDEHGIDATSASDLYWKLYSHCEKMKIELSACINASFVIRVGDKKLIGSMKREEYERMCAPLLERVKGPLEEALYNAGLSVEDIQSVQCVGLTSQVPAIIKKLTDFFGREPIHAWQKDHLVSFGCTKKADGMSMFSNTITDIFPFSIAMSWNTKEVTIEGDGQAVVFPKGCPMTDTIKEVSFSSALTFSVGFEYSDIADPMIETRIGRFEIGPFQSKTGAKVQGKFIVLLDEDGIFSVESAYISEDGKWVKIQVSLLNESQELAEESNQDELLHLIEKLEKTEHLLSKEKEKRQELEAQIEELKESSFKHEEMKHLIIEEKEEQTVDAPVEKKLHDFSDILQKIKDELQAGKETIRKLQEELTQYKLTFGKIPARQYEFYDCEDE